MVIAVIMGGISSEREVSLKTGQEIINNIDNKYTVKEIILNKKNEIFNYINDIDFAFIALHGKFGEDGSIQAILESNNIPYSGSGVLSSSLCMNKDICKKILRDSNINTAKWITIKHLENLNYEDIDEIGYPVVIKPVNGGSSILTYLINNKDEVYKAVSSIIDYGDEAMVEKYIKGDEYSSFILDKQVFPTMHIDNDKDIYDYNDKYKLDNKKKKIKKLEINVEENITNMSIKCWEVLRCRGYIRVDFIIKDAEIYVLEINTLPAISKDSLIVKSANERNLSMGQLIDKIIEISIK